MLADPPMADHMKQALKTMPDLERALSRLGLGHGGPRDLAAMAHGISAAGMMADAIDHRATSGIADDQLAALKASLSGSSKLIHIIREALSDELPLLAREGGFIRKGYDTVLDEDIFLIDHNTESIWHNLKHYWMCILSF